MMNLKASISSISLLFSLCFSPTLTNANVLNYQVVNMDRNYPSVRKNFLHSFFRSLICKRVCLCMYNMHAIDFRLKSFQPTGYTKNYIVKACECIQVKAEKNMDKRGMVPIIHSVCQRKGRTRTIFDRN